MRNNLILFLVVILSGSCIITSAQNKLQLSEQQALCMDIPYGAHEKQCFDIWPVPGAKEATPLAIYIHGGGFRGGDKSLIKQSRIDGFHKAGIAFCSMNYRLSDEGPYPIMMEDAARGLQTIRYRAKEWNIDPNKIGCFGGSAGAGISLWLAFHDDLADPNSDDPIAQQSTRILAVATISGQSTYDMRTFREWFGVPTLEPHSALVALFGVETEADWETEVVRKRMTDASSITHLSKDDTVPVYMIYKTPNTPVDKTTEASVWVHHVKLGLKLQKVMTAMGLECDVRAPDLEPEHYYSSMEKFIIAKLNE